MDAIKKDKGKPELGLIPQDALIEIAQALMFGKTRYGAHNWTKGMDWHRLVDAFYRHVGAWKEGEDCDKESSVSHLAHAACCIMFLIVYQKRGLGKDTRFNWSLGDTNNNTNDKDTGNDSDLSALGPDCERRK